MDLGQAHNSSKKKKRHKIPTNFEKATDFIPNNPQPV